MSVVGDGILLSQKCVWLFLGKQVYTYLHGKEGLRIWNIGTLQSSDHRFLIHQNLALCHAKANISKYYDTSQNQFMEEMFYWFSLCQNPKLRSIAF